MPDQISDRGLRYCHLIQGTDPEEYTWVYESSNARHPCMWISVIDRDGDRVMIELDEDAAQRLSGDIMRILNNHHHYRREFTSD